MSEMPAEPDPRTYLAAERTFLAWLRSGVALMGFGFVIARFGLFLREIAGLGVVKLHESTGGSLWVGLLLVVAGAMVIALAAWRLRVLVVSLDRQTFRRDYSIRTPLVMAVLLSLLGAGLVLYLLRL